MMQSFCNSLLPVKICLDSTKARRESSETVGYLLLQKQKISLVPKPLRALPCAPAPFAVFFVESLKFNRSSPSLGVYQSYGERPTEETDCGKRVNCFEKENSIFIKILRYEYKSPSVYIG